MTQSAASNIASDLVPRPVPGLLSLVLPVLNEEEMLPHLKAELVSWRQTVPFKTEIVFVNDGSTDGTMRFLRDWAAQDSTVKIISFTRNFGHQIAISAGLEWCSGDAVAILDADLQDPLSVLPEMVTEYQAGYDVIYGIRAERLGESFFKRGTAWIFYRLMRLLVTRDLPVDTGDFRVVSRRCVDIICSMPEGHRFMRGLFSWIGLPHKGVNYVRNPRIHGSTKYSILGMLRFATNAALSFSPLPMRVISFIGVLVAMFGFLYGCYAVIRWWYVGDTVQGWPTLVVLVSVLSGVILIALGIVGEYVSRIYETVKQRPLYVLGETLNAPKVNR